MTKTIIIALLAICLTACNILTRNYKPAGFESANEVYPYFANSIYYSGKLTPEEWNAFYTRFPGNWTELQGIIALGGTMESFPLNTAYAFRWTTLNKKSMWTDDVLQRLSRHEIKEDDDIYIIIFALGPPQGVIWDNDFEILLYKPDKAIIMNSGKFSKMKICNGCWKLIDNHLNEQTEWIDGDTSSEVLQELNLERPRY